MKLIINRVTLLVMCLCFLSLSGCSNSLIQPDKSNVKSTVPNYANVMNFSLAASNDNLNYYINEMAHPETGKVKNYIIIDNDKGEQIRILDMNALGIDIYDNMIYFMNEDDNRAIYKMNFDGSNVEKVTDCYGDNMNFSDGWIYYNDYEENGQIFKLPIAGGEPVVVSSKACWELNVVDDWVYYIGGEASLSLCKMKSDGTEDQILYPKNGETSVSRISYHDDYIYLKSEFGLGRFEPILQKMEYIYDKRVRTYNFYKDKILFIDQKAKTLCVMNLDGTDVKVIQKLDAEYLNVAGDVLYCKIWGKNGWAQEKLYIPDFINGVK